MCSHGNQCLHGIGQNPALPASSCFTSRASHCCLTAVNAALCSHMPGRRVDVPHWLQCCLSTSDAQQAHKAPLRSWEMVNVPIAWHMDLRKMDGGDYHKKDNGVRPTGLSEYPSSLSCVFTKDLNLDHVMHAVFRHNVHHVHSKQRMKIMCLTAALKLMYRIDNACLSFTNPTG